MARIRLRSQSRIRPGYTRKEYLRLMSLTKLDAALSVVLVISVSGFHCLRAQTREVTDTSVTARLSVLTTELKKGKGARNAGVDLGRWLDAKSEAKRDAGNSNSAGGWTTSNGNLMPERRLTEGAPVPQTASKDEWHFQFTPYLWSASISGQAGIGNLTIDTDSSVTDSDVEVNFGFMSTFEARKNRFVLQTDLQYSDLSAETTNPGPLFSSTRASFKTFILDPEVGYRIIDNDKGSSLDLLGGIRYWHLTGNLELRAGTVPEVQISRTRDWVDGVVGLRGKAALSKHWFVTGKADLGGGGSEFTYQLFGRCRSEPWKSFRSCWRISESKRQLRQGSLSL